MQPRTCARAVLAVACLALAAPAFAQQPYTPPLPRAQQPYSPPPPGSQQPYSPPPPGAQQPYTPQAPGAQRSYAPPGPPSTATIDQRLANLHGRLGLNASQEGAWRAFFDAMHTQAQQMQDAGSRMSQPAPTAPERFAQMAQVMQQSASSMGIVAQALGTLYAQLSPQQRSVIETEFQAQATGGGAGGPPLR